MIEKDTALVATAATIGLVLVVSSLPTTEVVENDQVVVADSANSSPLPSTPLPAADQVPALNTETVPVYPDNLNGWIHEALDIMADHGIKGSYDGIYRNVIRESAGNPNAINLWDSNAAMGIPSKGLLQTIDPTFAAYHVPGTEFNVYNPVSNIVAACNYADDKYGSIDNVHGAY